ncbi:terminase [Clostridium butyricum]|uniref:terminase n=1 Tax=Clostridium butyricum TaxID=1492 RepID=UPI0021033EF2|nr:terminase [Clostridium butyricum]MCQ2016791.1 terminase [Clostridium butyricum]
MIYYDNLEFSSDVEYEVYILNKYLTKHYDSKSAKELLRSYNDNLDGLAKSLGHKDIGFYCEYFLREIFVPSDDNTARELCSSHYELWDMADRMLIQDEFDKTNIVCPRGFAKTTIYDFAVISWCICYKESIFTILIGKKDKDATQFMDDILQLFEKNKRIIDNFGQLIDRKKNTVNANEIEFSNGCDLQAVGSGTSIRGRKYGNVRPTLVIGDDAQDDNDVLTAEARQKKYDTWCKQVENVGDTAVYRKGKKIKKATKIVSIGTVLHLECLISRLSKNPDYKTILKRAIILKDGQTVDDIFESDLWQQCHDIYFDEKFNENQRYENAKKFYLNHYDEMQFPVLWPEKWDCFEDLAVDYWKNRKTFMSEKMNDGSSIGEKWFKSIRTQISEEIENHRFIKTMLTVDPASTTKKKSDSTNIMVGSKAVNDFTYVRDVVHKKMGFKQYCEKVVDLLRKYLDITHINIEKNTFQGADVLKIQELIKEDPILRPKKYIWINEMQKKNKDEKISTITDSVNNGAIIMVSDKEDSKKAIDEILEFQGQEYSPHDDAPDNLSELENKLKEIKPKASFSIIYR